MYFRSELTTLSNCCQVDRLGQIALDVKVLGLEDVLVRAGTGQHDDWHRGQALIGPDVDQYLAAAFLGQIQVQQDQVGLRGAAVVTLAVEEFHGLFAVANQTDPARHLAFAQVLRSSAQRPPGRLRSRGFPSADRRFHASWLFLRDCDGVDLVQAAFTQLAVDEDAAALIDPAGAVFPSRCES